MKVWCYFTLCLINPLPAKHRTLNGNVEKGHGIHSAGIFAENDEVGKLASFKHAFDVFLKGRISAMQRPYFLWGHMALFQQQHLLCPNKSGSPDRV